MVLAALGSISASGAEGKDTFSPKLRLVGVAMAEALFTASSVTLLAQFIWYRIAKNARVGAGRTRSAAHARDLVVIRLAIMVTATMAMDLITHGRNLF